MSKLLSELLKGTYNAGTSYTVGDIVDYNGSSYANKVNSTGNLPTNTTYWALLAEKGATGATGSTGATGATGAAGANGSNGADGLDITWLGAYAGGTSYVINDAVSYDGSSYICILASTGNLPTNGTYWNLMASKGATGAGTGDVSKVGTPVNNQVGVWTGDGTLEGDASLTFDTTTDTLAVAASGKIAIGAVNIIDDTAGTTTLSNIDALDATTEATIEGAIDTLANLTSIQGRTVTLADAGANAIFGWDDVAGAYENLTQGEVRAVAGLATTDSPEFAGVNVGHASDTTITRVSAGVAAIEGKNILTTDGGTLTGNITLGENTSIDLDPAGSADGKYSGICITGTAGAALAFGDLIYLAVADSRWELTDSDATATSGTPLIGMCVLAAAGDGSATKILLQGTIRADAKFPVLTVGAPAYVGETAGAIQTTIPTGADNVIRVVGRALTADELYFCPSQDHQVVVA